MDFTIQGASSHTQGAGSGLANRAPGTSPCRVALSPVPLSWDLPTSFRTDLARAHPALSWESGMGYPRSLGFCLDSEAACDWRVLRVYGHPLSPALRPPALPPCVASSSLSFPLLTTLPLGLRFLDCPPWLSPPGCPAFPISAAPRQPFLPHHPSPSAACAIS